ncbi:VanZ family protein [Nocardioides sp. YIM 152588]|uniref:VanZ family protein n=1 Tax=Nocardioides sp. YIM 152588 TaxID=3158259 RepID=UPI0032E5106F
MLHRHPLLSLLTGAYLVFVGWLTLTPQADHARTAELVQRVLDALHRRGYLESVGYAEFEFLANIALFVPIGVFLLLLFGAGGWWLAILASFAMTIGIESLQTQIPGRVPDDRDLLANGLGAVVGVAFALVLTAPATLRRRRARARTRDLAGRA